MRIEFTQGGGLAYFPGLNQAVTIDVDRLDAGELRNSNDWLRRRTFSTCPPLSVRRPEGRLIINTMSSPLRIAGGNTPCASSSPSRMYPSSILSRRSKSRSRLPGRRDAALLPMRQPTSRADGPMLLAAYWHPHVLVARLGDPVGPDTLAAVIRWRFSSSYTG